MKYKTSENIYPRHSTNSPKPTEVKEKRIIKKTQVVEFMETRKKVIRKSNPIVHSNIHHPVKKFSHQIEEENIKPYKTHDTRVRISNSNLNIDEIVEAPQKQ